MDLESHAKGKFKVNAPVEAKKLLHRGGFKVPVDLQAVCEFLGLKLLIGDLDTLDGLFLAKQGGGMGVVLINKHRREELWAVRRARG